MKHGKKFNSLSRKSAHRKALMANMASALIEHKRIKTTTAKAKALRTYIEPILTRAKSDTTHNRRMAFKYLQNKFAVNELFTEISDKIANRPGGYTRIIKLEYRFSDSADIAYIELVDYNEDMIKDPKASKGGKKKRSRRGGKGKSKAGAAAAAATTAVAEKADEIKEDVKDQVDEATENNDNSEE